jgi:FkbM family methyltransferase
MLPESLYVRARTEFVSRRVARYTPRTVSHVYGGFPLSLSLEDPVAEEWYDQDMLFQKDLGRLALRQSELVFDLGAHQAVVALIASRTVGETGRVIAVEAEPHNVRVARTNVALNGVDNVELVPAAVASHEGSVQFAEGLNGRLVNSGRLGTLKVPAVTIDSLAAEYGHPDAVLVDVEGAEVMALQGAAATIRQGTRFMIEVHLGCGLEELGGHPEQLVRLLDGYRFEYAEADGDDSWHWGSAMKRRSFLFAEPR